MKTQHKSAGILVFRRKPEIEFFLVHPGGPFWAKKDEGAWSIPKGEFDEERALEAAIREFKEETGQTISGNFIELLPIIQKAGKLVQAWAVESEIDENQIRSNHFEMQWPPKSGRWQSYPEVDKANWFNAETARKKINPAQVGLLDQVLEMLAKSSH